MPTSPPGSCLGYLGPLAGLQRGCMGQREKDILARGSNSFRRAQNERQANWRHQPSGRWHF